MIFKTTTALVTLMFPVLCFSQQTSSKTDAVRSSVKAQHPTHVTNSDDKIKLVSSNQVSSTIVVHTFKLVNATTNAVQDQNPSTPNSEEVLQIIETFNAVEGVSECTFDQATQTFTVLATPLTDLNKTLNQLNK